MATRLRFVAPGRELRASYRSARMADFATNKRKVEECRVRGLYRRHAEGLLRPLPLDGVQCEKLERGLSREIGR
jgi:hypothetical protein